MPPKVIGPYRVLETLGSGGVGTVYRAVDRRTGEAVALKLLSTGPALDPRAARRLAREFETLAELSHPNVVKVFDTGVYQGYPYLAMELVEGLTLRHYLVAQRRGRPSRLARPARASRLRERAAASASEPLSDDVDELEPADVRALAVHASAFGEETPSEEAELRLGPGLGARAGRRRGRAGHRVESRRVRLPYEVAARPGAEPPSSRAAAPDLEELNRPSAWAG